MILSNCLHINLQYTFEQFKSIVSSKYNSIDNSINKNNLMMNSLSKNSYLYTTKPNLNKLPNDSELQEQTIKKLNGIGKSIYEKIYSI